MSPQEQQLELFEELSQDEGFEVEFKSARGGLPGSLWETYSAFANTNGGTIWLGVAQKDGIPQVQGIEAPDKLRSQLWDQLHNCGKVSRNLLQESDIAVLPLENMLGLYLIRMRVPRATRRERPVYIGPSPFAGTYRRNHEGDYLCTEDEVRRMFADQSDEPADSRILDGFTLEDLHAESIQQYRNRFASLRPTHPWLQEDDRGLLEQLGGLRRDRSSGREGITVAGLLMFGREQAIRDPAAVPGFQLDYREHFTDDASVRWTDRLTLDGTWEGNLFQFYQRIIVKLSSGPGVRQPFQVDAEGYRRSTTPVHEALQEALVNALIHADYSGQGGIVIERYVDHIDFSNPGILLLSREQLLQGSISECRNKSLQRMFQMLGVGDKAGSGIAKIRQSWAAQHWRSPRLRETLRPERVVLELPMISMLPPEAIEVLQSRFGQDFQSKLSSDQVQVLVSAAQDGTITNQSLQDILTLHPRDITFLLKGLVNDGYLVADGARRGMRYSLAGSVPASTGFLIEIPSSPVSPGDSPVTAPSFPVSPGDSPVSALNSPAATSGDGRSGASAGPPATPLADRVRASGRIDRTLVKQAILELCSDRYTGLAELTAALDRKTETLRQYVAEMVREGLLAPLYPNTPNHPQQTYRTRKLSKDEA